MTFTADSICFQKAPVWQRNRGRRFAFSLVRYQNLATSHTSVQIVHQRYDQILHQSFKNSLPPVGTARVRPASVVAFFFRGWWLTSCGFERSCGKWTSSNASEAILLFALVFGSKPSLIIESIAATKLSSDVSRSRRGFAAWRSASFFFFGRS